MPRRPDVACADCGVMMWHGTGSLPEGQARCRACRRANPQNLRQTDPGKYRGRYKTPCVDCAAPSSGVRCRSCSAKVRTIRPADDHRVVRWERESASPGLGGAQRTRLLRTWKAQGRVCFYCPELATTVDHVIPLVRGGTNYEGNLVPCCRRCNSSKAARTVAEWRHGRQASAMESLPDWVIPDRRVRKSKLKLKVWAEQLPAFNLCCGCGGLAGPKAEWCSSACNARTAYRRKVGIPDRAPLYGRAS